MSVTEDPFAAEGLKQRRHSASTDALSDLPARDVDG